MAHVPSPRPPNFVSFEEDLRPFQKPLCPPCVAAGDEREEGHHCDPYTYWCECWCGLAVRPAYPQPQHGRNDANVTQT